MMAKIKTVKDFLDMFNNKPSFYNLEVQFEEIDQGAVVYHPNYLTYMERARNFAVKNAGYSLRKMLDEKFVFAISQSNLTYRRSCRLHDQLVIATTLDKLKRASLIVSQLVFNGVTQAELGALSKDELLTHPKLAVIGELKLACIDLEKFSPKKIPQGLYDLLV